MKTAIAYLRVSSEQQAASGLGLEAQADACRALAQRLGLELNGIHSDQGVSGSTGLDRRPALLQAISELRRGDVLVVGKRDRLGRDPIAVAMIEAAVARRGARIVSAAGEGSDGDSPTDVLMRRIIDAFSEYERLVIAARTKAALKAKRQRGERAGAVPFGYTADDQGRLVPDAGEQDVLQMIRELRAQGLSIRQIAGELNAQNIPARGKQWHATTIARMVKDAA